MKSLKMLSVVLVVACVAVSASAGTVTFTHESGNWSDRALEIQHGLAPPADGTDFYCYVGGDGEPTRANVIAFDDLFTLLPASSDGDDIQITNATLSLTTKFSSGTGTAAYVSRITTPWLTAGVTEATVTGASGWATGVQYGGSIGDKFYPDKDTDSANRASVTWNGTYNTAQDFDITDILQDLYDSGLNDGFAFYAEGVGNGGIAAESSEGSTTSRPRLIVEYEYVPEPATMGLLLMGGIGVLARKRR
jgi:hypothetical protein